LQAKDFLIVINYVCPEGEECPCVRTFPVVSLSGTTIEKLLEQAATIFAYKHPLSDYRPRAMGFLNNRSNEDFFHGGGHS